jgi:hypothetical protein
MVCDVGARLRSGNEERYRYIGNMVLLVSGIFATEREIRFFPVCRLVYEHLPCRNDVEMNVEH